MKISRFILMLLAATVLTGSGWAVTRTLTMSLPAIVVAGQNFSVPCSASTDQGGSGEQVAYFYAEYSLDAGVTWTGFCYDVTTGSTVNRTIPITAGNGGSTIVVRIMGAFRGGPANDVDYTGATMDWSGAWSNWQMPPAKYGYISVRNPATSITADTIITNGPVAITSPMNITYQAKRLIRLEPGFSVTAGGLFNAFLTSITSPGAAAAVSGSAFNYQISGGNGQGTYSATGLPSGLSINTSTGAISGTPTVNGRYYVVIGFTDVNGTYSTTILLNVSGSSIADTDGDTLPDVFDPHPGAGQAGTIDTANTTVLLKVTNPL